MKSKDLLRAEMRNKLAVANATGLCMVAATIFMA